MTQATCNMDELLSDGLMTIREAAAFLRIGQSTVYELMYAGRLLHVKIGRSRRIPKRALIELAKDGLVGPIPAMAQ